MKYKSLAQAKSFTNSACSGLEYHIDADDTELGVSYIELRGRYPEQGRITNELCKEVCYIKSGTGQVVVEGEPVELIAGDMIMLEPNDRYYWQGALDMVVACTPAWTPEQHKHVD